MTFDEARGILRAGGEWADLAEAVGVVIASPESSPWDLVLGLKHGGVVAEQAALALYRRTGTTLPDNRAKLRTDPMTWSMILSDDRILDPLGAEVGDEEACRLFVARYGPMVRALSARAMLPEQDVDDVVQEVLHAAVEALRAACYDRSLGRFKHWFKGVIQHKISDARGARPKHRAPNSSAGRAVHLDRAASSDLPRAAAVQGLAELLEMPDPCPTPADEFESEFETQWRLTAIEHALDEIRVEVDPALYQAFDLYVMKNRPPAEVGHLLGLSRNAVCIAKIRIIERLREKLTLANQP